MRTMTLEELLMKENDGVLLDIYRELESRVVPATGYAHAYCRKVNKLINAGKLCTIPDKYRNVYLPTLSKMIFKEMSRRWAVYLQYQKTLDAKDDAEDIEEACDIENGVEVAKCRWCGDVHYTSEMRLTSQGTLCDCCIIAIKSRGEDIDIYD